MYKIAVYLVAEWVRSYRQAVSVTGGEAVLRKFAFTEAGWQGS